MVCFWGDAFCEVERCMHALQFVTIFVREELHADGEICVNGALGLHWSLRGVGGMHGGAVLTLFTL